MFTQDLMGNWCRSAGQLLCDCIVILCKSLYGSAVAVGFESTEENFHKLRKVSFDQLHVQWVE